MKKFDISMEAGTSLVLGHMGNLIVTYYVHLPNQQ